MRNLICLAILALALTGCTTTKGKDICVDIRYEIVIKGNGNITFAPSSDLETLSRDTDQDAESSVPVDIKVPLPIGG